MPSTIVALDVQKSPMLPAKSGCARMTTRAKPTGSADLVLGPAGLAPGGTQSLGAESHPCDDDSAAELPLVSDSRFLIEGEIARGGLGRILRGRDRQLGRPVAIKVALHRGDEARARFLREVAVTARLQHPAIIPLYEAGRWTDGELFYAMKLISGCTLKEAISEKRNLDERLGLLPNVIAVAEAIAYAHAAGVIHRDLKPANVLVGPFGETVVIDWGVAREVSERGIEPEVSQGLRCNLDAVPACAPLTATGAVLGTPAYMPPEQAAGSPVDMRADVYAIGAILYHVLTGGPPSTASRGTEALAWVLMGAVDPIERREPGVPRELAAIVKKAMARSPGDRYASANELAEELKRFQTGQLVRAHHYTIGALVRRWMGRHRAAIAVVALLGVLAVTAAVTGRRIVQARNLEQQLAASRSEAEELTKDLESGQPWDALFFAGQDNPQATRKIAIEIQRIFGKTGATASVECKAAICKLELVRRDGQAEDFDELVQRDAGLKAAGVTGHGFGSGEPGNDALGRPIWHDTVLLRLSEAPAGPRGTDILEGYYSSLLESGALRRCHAEHGADTGVLELKLHIDADGEVSIKAGGSLAPKEGGRCLVVKLDEIVQRGRVSGPVTPGTVFFSPRFPPAR